MGEIALVVIGILIALQINNWNENRKDRIRETEILRELAVGIEQNNQSIQEYLEKGETYRKSSEIVIAALENRIDYHDSLNLHFQFARIPHTILSLTSSGYENAKNVGLEIIRAQNVRKSIIDLFEVHYGGMMKQFEYFASFQPDRATYIDNKFYYNVDEFLVTDPIPTPLIPFEYFDLLDDHYLLAMFKSVMIQRRIMASNASFCLVESKKVFRLIQEELDEG
jgi:hypothetical protein